MNVSAMPDNNNSAIVVCSPSNATHNEHINEAMTHRASTTRCDNTPERNVVKLLHTNSSSQSISKNSKSKNRDGKSKGLQKKKMKLRNLINNNLYNTKKGSKMPKLGEIGMSLLHGKRKKSQLNISKHQNSEYIDIQNNLS
jgi:hypothetical protein